MADDVELMGAALEERVQHCEARLRELSGRMGRHSALMDQQTWAGVQARHAALLRQGGPEVFRCFSCGSLVSWVFLGYVSVRSVLFFFSICFFVAA